jgi:hypothetical protein
MEQQPKPLSRYAEKQRRKAEGTYELPPVSAETTISLRRLHRWPEEVEIQKDLVRYQESLRPIRWSPRVARIRKSGERARPGF